MPKRKKATPETVWVPKQAPTKELESLITTHYTHGSGGWVVQVETSDTHYFVDIAKVPGGQIDSGYGVPRKFAPPIEPGDYLYCYTYRGSAIRGVDMNGKNLFFYSDQGIELQSRLYSLQHEAGQIESFLKEEEALDHDYLELPDPLQERLDRFRAAGGVEWRYKFEGYEMAVCKCANIVYQGYVKSHLEDPNESFEEYWEHVSGENFKMFPKMEEMGLSGNQVGFIGLLSRFMAEGKTDMVVKLHGALTPLVGCEEYSCLHPQPEDTKDDA